MDGAGVHVDGLIKDPLNYQGIDPADLGRCHQMVLGKHSGTHAVVKAYSEMGLMLHRDQASSILGRIRDFVTRTKRTPGNQELMQFYDQLAEVKHMHA